MSQVIHPSAPSTQPRPARASSSALIEIRQTALLVVGFVLLGLFGQIWLPPSPVTFAVGTLLGAVSLLAAAFLLPGKLKDTLHGFRFTSTILFALALAAALGTVVLQGKPPELYHARYGSFGGLILALRLDDIFHSLPFAGIMALFVAGTALSSIRRLPVTRRNAGFHIAHLGLLVSLAGAGISSTMSVRGRVDLREGQSVSDVRVTRARQFTGEVVPLGFSMRLDDFGLDKYESENRLSFWQRPEGAEAGWRMKASWEPGDQSRHRLPEGAAFQVLGYYPDVVVNQKLMPSPNGGEPRIVPEYSTASNVENNPAVAVRLTWPDGRQEERLLAARSNGYYTQVGTNSILAFQRRPEEVKTYRSRVTVTGEDRVRQAEITVNDPLSENGWMVYQVNYNPDDLSYSGFEVVHDPGVPLVFTGFALIGFGVIYMFNIAPRFKRRKAEA